MRRRWRFLMRVLLWSLLSLLLLTLAIGYWLSASGRLATIASHFAQRLSGQDITIGATALRSWHTIVFTEIAIQADLGGWHLTVACPEVAARVGLWGLLTQQIQYLSIAQPHITLRLPADPISSTTTTPSSLVLPALPVKQLLIQQGKLDIHSPQRQHTLEHLSVRLWQESAQLHTELQGSLDGSPATVRLQGDFPLGTPLLTGTLHVQAQELPLAFLSPFLPASWEVSQGTLALQGDITLQGPEGRGQFFLDLAHLQGQGQGLLLEDALFSAQVNWQGNFAQQAHTLTADTTLRLFRLSSTTAPLTNVTLTAPLQLTVGPSSWQLKSVASTLQADWHQMTYTVEPLRVHVQATPTEPFLWEIQASLQDTPTTAQVSGRKAAGNTTMQLTGQHIPITLLSAIWQDRLPAGWHKSQGTLAFTGELTFQDATLQGMASLTLSEGQIDRDDLRFQAANLTLNTTFTQRLEIFSATGQLDVQIPSVTSLHDIAATDTKLVSAFDFTFTPTRWTLQAKPVLQSADLHIAVAGHLQHLHLTIPLDITSTPEGFRGQGPLTITARALTWQPAGHKTPLLQTRDIKGQLPLKFQGTAVEITDAQLRTGPWSQPTRPQLLDRLALQASARIDVSHQRSTIHNIAVTLGDIANVHSSGIWDWQHNTLRDLQLQTALPDLALVWQHLGLWLPEFTRPWQYTGGATLTIKAPRFDLNPPWSGDNLQLTGEIRDGAFSIGQYATEKLYGKLRATVAFDPKRPRYTVQGSAAFQPFALLIGAFLPDLTTQKITPDLAFTGTYEGRPAHLHITLSGDVDSLGTIQGRASLQEPFVTAPYEIEFNVEDMDLKAAWQAMLYDSALFPSLAEAQVQGRLQLHVEMQGHAQDTMIRGTLQTQGGSFATPSFALYGVNLYAPFQGRYPFPDRAPDLTALPASAYGTLSLDGLRIGNVQTGGLRTRFAFSSDNLWIPDGLHVDLLGGEFFVGTLLAQNFLQPTRRFTLNTTVKNLDLQKVPHTAESIPLAGVLEGAFSQIEISQGHLHTDGSLLWHIADGNLRLTSLQGDGFFSTLPTIQCSIGTEQPISLAQLTRLYPIGAMSGTLDVALQNFTLTGDVPTAFQLRFAVHERGGEPREITLRALNNLLFTTGTSQIAAGLFGIGDTYRLPYRRFGVSATLRNDILQLQGLYHDRGGKEYFMQAPPLGHGVSIVNQVPDNGISFQAFMQRLRATVLEKPEIQLAPQR